MGNLLPLLFKLIVIAPQIQNAIKTGIPIVDAVMRASPDLLPLLEQIGKTVFPQLSGTNAQWAAGNMIFNVEMTKTLQADLNKLGANLGSSWTVSMGMELRLPSPNSRRTTA